MNDETKTLLYGVLALQKGRMCWCDFASGNPMVTEHSPPCRNMRGLVHELMGPGKAGGGEREVVPSNAAPGG